MQKWWVMSAAMMVAGCMGGVSKDAGGTSGALKVSSYWLDADKTTLRAEIRDDLGVRAWLDWTDGEGIWNLGPDESETFETAGVADPVIVEGLAVQLWQETMGEQVEIGASESGLTIRLAPPSTCSVSSFQECSDCCGGRVHGYVSWAGSTYCGCL